MIIENNVIKEFKSTDKTVTIPKGIRRIDEFAFENSAIEQIFFQDASLKIIGNYAFRNSTLLKELVLPDSVISIGTGSFKGCSNLEYLYIPPSVLDIDGEILSAGCKTIIVGERNSLAEEYATERNILFKVGSRRTRQTADERNDDSTTCEFTIFGVRINCSKGYPIFRANKQYYEEENSKLLNYILTMLPSKTNENVKFDDNMINKKCDETVTRLKSQGLIVTRDQILSMVSDSASCIIQIISKYYQLAAEVNNGLNTDITNMRNDLYAEAQSKITGVNYGVIGGPLDLMLHSIDNALAARKQYNQVSREASALDSQYTNKLVSQADGILSKLYREVKPILKEAVDTFSDDLCTAENTVLSDAGIMNLDTINGVDEAKSKKFIDSLKNNDEDADYKIGLALKHNPYNTLIYKKAFNLNLASDELIKMIRFLDFGGELNKQIEDYYQKLIRQKDDNNYNLISAESSLNNRIVKMFDYKDQISEQLFRSLVLESSSLLLNAKEEALSKRIGTDCSVEKYCEKALNDTVDETVYNKLFVYCNSDFELSKLVSLSYSELLQDWIKTKEKIVRAYGNQGEINREDYLHVDEEIEYQTIKNILASEGDISFNRDSIIARLDKLGNYKDCGQLIEQIKGLEFDEEYNACIKMIEGSASQAELDIIISKLSAMNNYKESNFYIKVARKKKSDLEKKSKEDEIESLRLKLNAANSPDEMEEVERLIRPHQYEHGYVELYREFVQKKNAEFIDNIKKALSSASNKSECLALKEMIEPRVDELGIRDLYLQVYNKIEELDSTEKYEQIMAKAVVAKSAKEYDEIIDDLRLIVRTNKNAESQINNMIAKKGKLLYKEINSKVMSAKTTKGLAAVLMEYNKLPNDISPSYKYALKKLQTLNAEISELEIKLSRLFSLFQGTEKAETKRQISIKEKEKNDLINELIKYE